MFRGLSQVIIDSKGRFSIPTKHRADITSESKGVLVVTIDTVAPCLLLYTLREWELIESKLQQLPSFDPEVRRVQRLLIGHATELEMDSVGRVLLPSLLREYAALDKHIMLVGQGNKFEIWNESDWEEFRRDLLKPTTITKSIEENLKNLSL
jgi:MraZ protein